MRLSKTVFALLALLSHQSFGSETLPSLTLSTRYKMESSHFNTWENTILYDPRLTRQFLLDLGAQMAVSKSDFESLHYKIEPSFLPFSWLELHLRLSRKIFLAETASFTHVFSFAKLQTPDWGGFRFFTKVGWYYRFWELHRGTLFPVPLEVGYTEYDFALGLGVSYETGSGFFGKFEAATFEEMDVNNLNHPFLELRGGLWLTDFWTLTGYGRYQVLLGFGRLDRFIFGFTMDFITDRFWAE